ncbi:MAG TPA: alpha/beta fold hydrolase [Candidatus Acidoferrales bacterium]|nr:alpha/beta fold hydrolase [Candidatus Acidoferrales bacterium]
MPLDLIRVRAQRNEVAVLVYEPRRPRNVAIVAGHGYSSSKHNLDFLCAFLQSHGFRVYNLDFPGHKLGASGGELRGFDDCIDAMRAVVAHARAQHQEPLYTLGHSMGAATALLVAAADPSIEGAIAIATSYGRPGALATLRAAGAVDFRSSYVVGVDLPELFADADERFERSLPQLAGRPVLYVAASRDAMVPPKSVRELYDRAPDPKDFVTIESDHTYAGEHARGDVLQWLNQRHPRG